MQPDLADFIARVKAMGYLVKLDTNGTLPKRLKAILQTGMIDYVAMDIKSAPASYARAVGCEIDTRQIAESLRLLRESGVGHELRTTAVKGIHTSNDFTEIGKWLGDGSAYFIQGFVDSGNLLGGNCAAFSAEEMQELLQAVTPYIPTARLRGQA